MHIQEAIETRRSIRRFQGRPVKQEILTKLVDLARLHASGGNLQLLRYAIVSEQPLRDQLFAELKWAMYLPEFEILPSQRPGAYIVILSDTQVRKACQYDLGAASTTMMLAAREYGLDTCALGAFSAKEVSRLLDLPEALHPELVLAIGYRAQESTVVPMEGSVRYTMDDQGNLRVPKWSLEEVLVMNK